MKTKRYRFESEVHLGLLMIVFLLIFLSFVSNFVLYRARVSLREQTTGRLQSAAIAITRGVQQNYPVELTEQDKQGYLLRYGLSGLQLVASKPPDESMETRKRWFAQIVKNLPPSQLTSLVPSLLGTEFRKLTRGKGSEYFFVQPLPPGSGKHVLILSSNVPDLAFLDDSSRTVFWTGVGALGFVAIVYLILSRFIFKPFRRIREQAQKAGRPLPAENDDADLVVEEYRQIITELRDKEAELMRLNAAMRDRAESLEQFNQYLLSSIDSGIITLDIDGNVKTLNEAAARMLALRVEEAAGTPFKAIFGELREIPILVARALKSGKAVPYEEIRHNTGKGIQTFGVSVSFVRDAQQLPVGLSILVNDLSELSELRTRVEQKDRLAALGEMSGGLAHQLRNSMGAINGYAMLARKRITKGETVQVDEAMEQLLQESKEAENLIGKFLNFARPFDFNPRPTSVSNLLREIVNGYRSRDDCKQITFRFEAGFDASLSADPLLLKQALTNLIDNAVLAYEGKSGVVVTAIDSDHGRVKITVTDSACGIEADKLDKIFTPFYSSRPSGTGLGLPLASRIVDLHGGHITVTSIPGKGTTFTVELPALARAAAPVS